MARSSVPPSGATNDGRRLWRLAGMGFTLTSEILAGTLIGWLLDRAFNTGHTWLIIGTIAGVVIGLLTFFRIALRESRGASAQATRSAERMRAEGRLSSHDDDHDDADDYDDRPAEPR